MTFTKFTLPLLISLSLTLACAKDKPSSNSTKNPTPPTPGGSTNIAEKLDTDNDGVIDSLDKCEGDDSAMVTLYADLDGDGLGDIRNPQDFCVEDLSDATNYVEKLLAIDTDDSNNDVDGDGVIDGLDKCAGNDTEVIVTLYADTDGDGYGNHEISREFCPEDIDRTGWVIDSTDENDAQPDSDQDGVADDLDKCPGEDDANWDRYFIDEDEDWFPDSFAIEDSVEACKHNNGNFDGYVNGIFYTPFKGSLDINPGLKDSDQDGIGDDVDPCVLEPDDLTIKIYEDKDGDGLGDLATKTYICSDENPDYVIPVGWVSNGSDLNDSLKSIDFGFFVELSGSLGEENVSSVKTAVSLLAEKLSQTQAQKTLSLIISGDGSLIKTHEKVIFTNTNVDELMQPIQDQAFLGLTSPIRAGIEEIIDIMALPEVGDMEYHRKIVFFFLDGPALPIRTQSVCNTNAGDYKQKLDNAGITPILIMTGSESYPDSYSCLVDDVSTQIVYSDDMNDSWFENAIEL